VSHLIEARPPAVPALLRDAIRRGIHGIYTGIRGGSALDLPPPLPPPGDYQVHYLFNGPVSAAPRRRIKTLHYAVPWVGFGSCFVGRMRRRRGLRSRCRDRRGQGCCRHWLRRAAPWYLGLPREFCVHETTTFAPPPRRRR